MPIFHDNAVTAPPFASHPLRPHHLGVSVPSLDQAIAWYARMLGFTEVEFRGHIEAIPAEVAFIGNGAFRFELFQLAQAAPLPSERRDPNRDLGTHGNKHLCLTVPDLDRLLEYLRAQGADIVLRATVQGSDIAFIRDCFGNLVELLEERGAAAGQEA